MSAVLDRVDVPDATTRSRRPVRFVLGAVPWLLVLAAWVVALRWWDTPMPDVAAYTIYWIFTLVLPGTLVHRAMRGSRGNWPEDLGFGAITGLVLELVAWVISAAVGGQAFLRWWPVPVVLLFLAVPALRRRHWRIADPKPLPVRWSWMIAAAFLALIAWAIWAWSTVPLPPADTVYYQDLMYHLALTQEMTRNLPFEVPQLAGDTLRYHYLSDAHMATASMITGIPPSTVLLRLYVLPLAAVALVGFAAIARDLTERWWAGPIAGATAFVGQAFVLGAPIATSGGAPISASSPSQTYSMPLLALLVAFAVDVLRRRRLGVAWVFVPVLAVACAGAKASVLPPVLAGFVLATVVAWMRYRKVPWTAFGMIACLLAGVAAGLRLFAGGGSGVLEPQALAILRYFAPYAETLGTNDGVDVDGLLPHGVAAATTAGVWFIVWVVAWWVLMQGHRMLGVTALLTKERRADPVAWLLGGTTLAGFAAAWLFYHPSASQIYFFQAVAPVGTLITVWMMTDRSRGRWRPPTIGLVLAVVWVYLIPDTPAPQNRGSMSEWSWAIARPIVWTLAVAAAVCLVALMFRARRAALASGLIAGVLGIGLGSGLMTISDRMMNAIDSPPTALDPHRMVTADEMRAAIWLDRNAAPDDVVATNVHCQPIDRPQPCDARAFWVAGLGGHRTVVESWGYSDQTVAANGVNGLGYPLQPAPYPSVFAQNEEIFIDGDAADLADFKQRFGVRWLFADARAGDVSPELAKLAAVRFQAGPVTIYQVH
jgi:hypothetical protein